MQLVQAIFGKIEQYFLSFHWQKLHSSLMLFFIFLDILLTVVFFWVLLKSLRYRPHFFFPKKLKVKIPQEKLDLKAKWDFIIKKSTSAPPHSFTLALIEADSFVDNTLRDMGFKGETMADRLKQLNSEELVSLNDVWKAHKARNELVHAPGADLASEEAKKFLGFYEEFLKEMRII